MIQYAVEVRFPDEEEEWTLVALGSFPNYHEALDAAAELAREAYAVNDPNDIRVRAATADEEEGVDIAYCSGCGGRMYFEPEYGSILCEDCGKFLTKKEDVEGL